VTFDLNALSERVRVEVDTYEVPLHSPDALGSPLPPEWFTDGFAEMRDLLVEPYRAEALDGPLKVIIVAEDPGHAALAFDPANDDYILGALQDGRFGGWNVRGDVACFLSR